MSNLEDAMKKYFGSEHDHRTTVSSSELEPTMAELEAESACFGGEYTYDTSPSNKNNTDLEKVLTLVELDVERLRLQGIITSDSRDYRLMEEYRNIKRPLLQNAFGQGASLINDGHLVLITSSIAGEGKTFTSINLAFSIARELDRTILLVDADVSRQGLSRMLGIENRRGLTDILSNQVSDMTEVLIRFDEPKLSFLPAGHMHPHVAELLSSENMRRLTRELTNGDSNRLILFDAPPILANSEARILASLVGQILLVVEAERTSQPMIQEAITYLDSSKVIGLVLNKSQQKTSGVYSYGYYDPRMVAAK